MSSAPTQEKEAKIQFNARVGQSHKRAVKRDSVDLDLTVDTIAEAILAKFFREQPTLKARLACYQAHVAATEV